MQQASRDLDRIVISGDRGAHGQFNRDAKSAKKQLWTAKRPDGELRESVHQRWLNCDGSSNNGYRYRDSINAGGKESKREARAIAIDAHIEGMGENARRTEAGDPTATETFVPMDRAFEWVFSAASPNRPSPIQHSVSQEYL